MAAAESNFFNRLRQTSSIDYVMLLFLKPSLLALNKRSGSTSSYKGSVRSQNSCIKVEWYPWGDQKVWFKYGEEMSIARDRAHWEKMNF